MRNFDSLSSTVSKFKLFKMMIPGVIESAQRYGISLGNNGKGRFIVRAKRKRKKRKMEVEDIGKTKELAGTGGEIPLISFNAESDWQGKVRRVEDDVEEVLECQTLKCLASVTFRSFITPSTTVPPAHLSDCFNRILPRQIDPHPTDPASNSSKNNLPIIIGSTIGGLVFLFVIVLTVVLFRRKQPNSRNDPRFRGQFRPMLPDIQTLYTRQTSRRNNATLRLAAKVSQTSLYTNNRQEQRPVRGRYAYGGGWQGFSFGSSSTLPSIIHPSERRPSNSNFQQNSRQHLPPQGRPPLRNPEPVFKKLEHGQEPQSPGQDSWAPGDDAATLTVRRRSLEEEIGLHSRIHSGIDTRLADSNVSEGATTFAKANPLLIPERTFSKSGSGKVSHSKRSTPLTLSIATTSGNQSTRSPTRTKRTPEVYRGSGKSPVHDGSVSPGGSGGSTRNWFESLHHEEIFELSASPSVEVNKKKSPRFPLSPRLSSKPPTTRDELAPETPVKSSPTRQQRRPEKKPIPPTTPQDVGEASRVAFLAPVPDTSRLSVDSLVSNSSSTTKESISAASTEMNALSPRSSQRKNTSAALIDSFPAPPQASNIQTTNKQERNQGPVENSFFSETPSELEFNSPFSPNSSSPPAVAPMIHTHAQLSKLIVSESNSSSSTALPLMGSGNPPPLSPLTKTNSTSSSRSSLKVEYGSSRDGAPSIDTYRYGDFGTASEFAVRRAFMEYHEHIYRSDEDLNRHSNATMTTVSEQGDVDEEAELKNATDSTINEEDSSVFTIPIMLQSLSQVNSLMTTGLAVDAESADNGRKVATQARKGNVIGWDVDTSSLDHAPGGLSPPPPRPQHRINALETRDSGTKTQMKLLSSSPDPGTASNTNIRFVEWKRKKARIPNNAQNEATPITPLTATSTQTPLTLPPVSGQKHIDSSSGNSARRPFFESPQPDVTLSSFSSLSNPMTKSNIPTSYLLVPPRISSAASSSLLDSPISFLNSTSPTASDITVSKSPSQSSQQQTASQTQISEQGSSSLTLPIQSNTTSVSEVSGTTSSGTLENSALAFSISASTPAPPTKPSNPPPRPPRPDPQDLPSPNVLLSISQSESALLSQLDTTSMTDSERYMAIAMGSSWMDFGGSSSSADGSENEDSDQEQHKEKAVSSFNAPAKVDKVNRKGKDQAFNLSYGHSGVMSSRELSTRSGHRIGTIAEEDEQEENTGIQRDGVKKKESKKKVRYLL